MLEDTFDRAVGIGGSDLAAVLGVSPWRSQFDVWLEKTRDPGWVPQEETPAMRFGTLVEPVLREVYEQEYGVPVTMALTGFHPNGIMYCHPDGLIEKDGIWEGKSAYSKADWSKGVPLYYETQVRQYLAITGRAYADITVMYRQTADIEHHRVEADPQTDQGLVALGLQWWNDHVVTGLPPAVDGSKGATEYLLNRWPSHRDDEPPMVATGLIDKYGQELIQVRQNIAGWTERETLLKNAIRSVMEEAGQIDGTGWHATYRRAKGATKVEWALVASAYRALLDLFGTDPEKAQQLLTDTDLDTIVGLYTTTGKGTRPFAFKVDE